VAEYSGSCLWVAGGRLARRPGDSAESGQRACCQQIKGEFRVKDAKIRFFFNQAIELINGLKKFEITHIGREKNKEADKLANKAIIYRG